MPEYWDPEIETMPAEDLKKLQEEKLKQLVHYVYERSPFYRKRFDEHGVKPEDIQTLEDVKNYLLQLNRISEIPIQQVFFASQIQSSPVSMPPRVQQANRPW